MSSKLTKISLHRGNFCLQLQGLKNLLRPWRRR